MGIEVSGLVRFVVGILDTWAGAHVVGRGAPVPAKVLWSLLIVFLPVLGLIIWLVAGPRAVR